MRHRRARYLPISLLPVLALASLPLAAGNHDEPELLVESSSGAYELDGETVLIIEEIVGTLSLRAAQDQTLRFEGRDLSSQRGLQEVALWRAGEHTLLLGPGAEVPADGTLVDMVVPDGLDVDVILVGGRVSVAGISGDLFVEAEGARVGARGLKGGGEFRLSGGQLAVNGVKQAFRLEGTDVKAEIQHLYEDAELELERGSLRITKSEAAVDAEFQETELALSRVAGAIHARGNGGSLRVEESEGGGELNLETAPLVLIRSKGSFDVRTDSSVEFGQHEGALTIRSYGAPILGGMMDGPLIIENNGSSVELKQLLGTAAIRGSDLKLRVDDCKGALNVHTVSSEIEITAAKSVVTVENEFGDVRVEQSAGALKISGRDGNVQVTDHQGPLEIRADGPEVRVGWTGFRKTERVTVQNASGDIHLDLPASGRCQLQLKAPFGRIDSSLDGIPISDDGHSGGGEYTGGKGRAPQVKKPLIQVTAGGGNIYIQAAASED